MKRYSLPRLLLAMAFGLTITSNLLFAQTDLNGELVVEIYNPTSALQITVEAVGVLWGDKEEGYPIIDSLNYYQVTASGFEADHIDNPNYPNEHIGYGRYKITIKKGGDSFVDYADYRDCDYQTHPSYFFNPDIRIRFDYTNEQFTTELDQRIWDGDHKYSQYPRQTGCFQIPSTVENNFSGGQFEVDDNTYTSPYSSDWSLLSTHEISAISPQNVGSGNYVWCAWSDAGAQTHNVSVSGSSSPLNFTATFAGTYITGPGYLTKGQTDTYDCNPACASGNCSYQWYKKYDGSEYWYTLGTAQAQQITMHSTASAINFWRAHT